MAGYNYTYDGNDRLVSAAYGEGTSLGSNAGRYDTHYQYDLMGNVEAVTRKGKLDDGSFSLIDDISMSYDGNRLVKADDSVEGPFGEGLFHFVDGADEEYEYSYDENGNMTKDLNRGIEEIRYNFLNLPSKITFTEKNAYIRNMYDANGHKFKMITYANIPLVIGRAAPAKASAVNKARAVGLIPDSLVYDTPFRNQFIPGLELIGVLGQTIYDYCGNIVYKNGVPTIYREDGFTTLARMRFPEFHYYIRDHQGNIRGVTDCRGNIEQQNDYYPFGGMMASSTGGAVQPYRYTGKELVRFQGLDWLDYGARWYDPAILHWNGVDKLAEKYTYVSPFSFCLNNPVIYFDPDGNKVILSGSQEERAMMLYNLQMLTNDELKMRKDGTVYIKSQGTMNSSYDLQCRTELISALIDNKRTTTIHVDHETGNNAHDINSENATNGVGSDVSVTFNPIRLQVSTINPKTGRLQGEMRPAYIGLAHELIHSIRSMKGVAEDPIKKVSYSYVKHDGTLVTVPESLEELKTVGIKKGSKYTENKIRKEHKFNLRGKY